MTFFDATLVQALIANYGHAAVFVVVMLDSSGLPVPSETVLVCAWFSARVEYRRDHRRSSLRGERALTTREKDHLDKLADRRGNK
jgi:hypothetical protein